MLSRPETPKRALAAFLLAGPCALTASPAEALVDAARWDDAASVASLLEQGADPNAREPDGASALGWAAIRGNAEIARLLLEAGADPNISNSLGIRPLAQALENGAAAVARLLLDHDADPNIARESGETPLMTAARLDQVDLMRLLIAEGADTDAHERRFGQTALMWAAGKPDAVRLLVASGANVRVATRAWDVKYTIYAPTSFTLGKTGIPWNTAGEYISKRGGQNALFFAVRERSGASVGMLLDAGLNANEAAADGTTPLLAALYNWVPLDSDFEPGRGAPASAGSSQRFAPDLAVARLLLDRGASATAADTAGYTPLHAAALAVALATRAEDRGGSGAYRRAPALLSLNFDTSGNSSFTSDGALGIVARLLDGGADPNRQTLYPTPGPAGDVRINPAPPGSTALHIAANSGSVALARMLLDAGAGPNLVRNDGHTPFSVAVVAGDLAVVKELAGRGTDLTMRYDPDDRYPDPVRAISLPRQGQTIVHIAAGTLAPDTVQYLASQGAPVDWTNEQGETPLELADHQERFQEALARQGAEGDPERLGAVKRPTATTAAIKRLLAAKGPGGAASSF